MHRSLADELQSIYKELYREDIFPEWGVKRITTGEVIPPSIPFIGNDYYSSLWKIVVYASAENLTHYEKDNPRKLLESDDAWNRHRIIFDEYKKSKKSSFFPCFHIAPVENGGLLCALQYVRFLLGLDTNLSPYRLSEISSFANFGKFSISSKLTAGKNSDYAGNKSKLALSIPYFTADLMVLKPDVLILPHVILRDKLVKQTIDEVIPNAVVLGLMQCNPRVMNFHLRDYEKRSSVIREEISLRFPELVRWTEEICEANLRKRFYRYYAHISDKVGCQKVA